jgi:hypothetical protein
MVVEVHPKYYVVTAIGADDQPILFKGNVRSWRVDHDQFCLSIEEHPAPDSPHEEIPDACLTIAGDEASLIIFAGSNGDPNNDQLHEAPENQMNTDQTAPPPAPPPAGPTPRDDGTSTLIIFAISRAKATAIAQWALPSVHDVSQRERRRFVPLHLIFNAGGVRVRFDWVEGSKLLARQMHNEPCAKDLCKLFNGRTLKTEVRQRSPQDESIYVTFDRPSPGGLFEGAVTNSFYDEPVIVGEHNGEIKMLSTLVPSSEHGTILALPTIKLTSSRVRVRVISKYQN